MQRNPNELQPGSAAPLVFTRDAAAGDSNDCRWRIGMDADGTWRFCGCPRHRTAAGMFLKYCARHSDMAARGVVPPPSNSPPHGDAKRAPRLQCDELAVAA
jgi:hypothetical protein